MSRLDDRKLKFYVTNSANSIVQIDKHFSENVVYGEVDQVGLLISKFCAYCGDSRKSS